MISSILIENGGGGFVMNFFTKDVKGAAVHYNTFSSPRELFPRRFPNQGGY